MDNEKLVPNPCPTIFGRRENKFGSMLAQDQKKLGSKLAALGNKKELLPLKSLGFALFDCKNLEEAEVLIKNLSAQGCEIVIIAENIVDGRQESFLNIIRGFPLAVLVLPQYKIRKNFAKNTVKKIIKEAVGF